MAVFQYLAVENGKKVHNLLFAPDQEQALVELHRRRIPVLDLKEIGIGNARMKKRSVVERKFSGLLTTRVKREQMLRQMASMLKAGVPVAQALEVAAVVAPKLMGKALWEASVEVRDGRSLADSINDKLPFLSPAVRGLIEMGEKGGQLIAAFESAAVLVRRTRQILRQVLQNLLYPFIVLFFLVGVSYYTIMYALPKIMSTITGLTSHAKTSLPWSYTAIQNSYLYLSENGLSILLVLAAVIAFGAYLYNTPKIRLKLDYLILKVPVLGGVLREYSNGMWCRTMGTLINNNVDIIRAITMTVDVMRNFHYRKNLLRLRELLAQGQDLSDGLCATSLASLCPMAVAMTRVGQTTGNIADNLTITAEYSEEDLLAKLAVCMELIQPFMIIALSIVIFFVLYAVYGAIWTIYNSYLPS